jgi:hypothetical protein
MSEKKITLENCKFTKKHRINSPRSIQALKELGIEYNSLIKESFESFISKNDEAKNLPEEIAKERYEHFEKQKDDLLNKAIEKRKIIIESQKKNRKQKTNDSLSQSQLNKTKTENNENENNEEENNDNENNENKNNDNNDEETAIKNQRKK